MPAARPFAIVTGCVPELMVASQRGEVRILSRWWSSWFVEPMQVCSAQERASMPGLLDTGEVAGLQSIGLHPSMRYSWIS